MMGQFESRSIASLLARNFETIKTAYQVLELDGDYAEFVSANEELLDCMPEDDLKGFLEGLPMDIFRSSATMSRLNSLQYAYLLTRYAEKSTGQNRLENTLSVLAEACYFSGFAEGMGKALARESERPDTSLSAKYAADAKHQRIQIPLKEGILRLLEAEALKREGKWKHLTGAIAKIQDDLNAVIDWRQSDLRPENLVAAIRRWCKRDTDFRKRLSEFVELPAQPSSGKRPPRM